MRYLLCAVALAVCVGCSRNTPVNEAPSAAENFPSQVDASGQSFYFEYQVTKVAEPIRGPKGPTYPPELRAANVEGDVFVQFVVDTMGLPDMQTLKILRSSHVMFTGAAREAIVAMRLVPAERKGRKVRQLVQQPFNFRLSR